MAILGAGGAGKAVACAIAQSKAQQIVIFDIDTNKANSTVDVVKKLSNDIDIKSVESIEKLDILNKDLLINATPVGMKESDPCLVAKEMLHKNLFVYDVIYNPQETKLLKLAKEVGAETRNGLGMLLSQGALSFEHWFPGKKAPREVMWKALLSKITT